MPRVVYVYVFHICSDALVITQLKIRNWTLELFGLYEIPENHVIRFDNKIQKIAK